MEEVVKEGAAAAAGPAMDLTKAAVNAVGSAWLAGKAIPAIHNVLWGWSKKGPSNAAKIPGPVLGPKNLLGKRQTPRRARASMATQMKRRLTLLEQKTRNQEGELFYKVRAADRLVAAANKCNFSNISFRTSNVEAALQQLRFFDPSNPGTYIVGDLTAGTQSKSAMVKAWTKVTYRNNYRVPVKLTVYKCIPKEDTNTAPVTAITAGIADRSGNVLNETNITVYPNQAEQFTMLWRIVDTKYMVLYPGMEYTSTHTTNEFVYDPSYVDSHALDFQAKLGSHSHLARIEGVVGHDTTVTTEQGVSASGVDIYIHRDVRVRYAAGANLKYIIEDATALDTFTNAANISLPNIEQETYGL